MEPDSFTAFAEMMVNRLSTLEQRVHTLETERDEQDIFRLQELPYYEDKQNFVRIVDNTVVQLQIDKRCIDTGNKLIADDILIYFHDFELWKTFDFDAFGRQVPSWKPVIDSILSSGKDEYDVTKDDLSDEAKVLVDHYINDQPMVQMECELMRACFKDDIRYFDDSEHPIFKTGGRLKTMEDLFVMTKEYGEAWSGRKQNRIRADIDKAPDEETVRLWKKYTRSRSDEEKQHVILSATRKQAIKFLREYGYVLDRSVIREIVDAHRIHERRIQDPARYHYRFS